MKPNKTQFCQAIINWYHRHGRHNLPWQKNTNAYKVWVSEIMLQQTQVNTVIPYFNAFMQKFPSVKQLATASLDDVLTLWSGLGYYARARNLHKTGQIIHENHHGRFPQNLEGLIQLPGIGRSTAGAILSLGMKKSASILDGNVKRVLTRAHAISDWPGKSHVLKALWQISEAYTPKKHCPEYNQAMMDIGSMICTRNKPNCTLCPINKFCMAHQTNSTHLYPTKKAKAKRITKKTKMLIIRNSQGQVLLKKRPPTGIWGGLWCFPECANNEDIATLCYQLTAQISGTLQHWPQLTHQFTHFELIIEPVLIVINTANICVQGDSHKIWHDYSAVLKGGIPAPVAKLLELLYAAN